MIPRFSAAPFGAASGSRLLAVLFYCAVALLLLPVWLFPYFPSQDGPSHLFNANVFLNYARVPEYQRVFLIQVPPAGNLTGHGLAILFLHAGVPAEDCEKLIVSLCIVGLAVAFHYALSAVKAWPVAGLFLILPFLYNWPLQMGFWSFSLGVPFVLICAGLCLRHIGQWNVRSLLVLFITAAAVYACHPISWAVSALIVWILALAGLLSARRSGAALSKTDRRRAVLQAILPVLMFVPFVIPNLLFAEQNEHVVWQRASSLQDRLWPFYTMSEVRLFPGDAIAAKLLFVILLLATVTLAILRLRRHQDDS